MQLCRVETAEETCIYNTLEYFRIIYTPSYHH